MAIAAVSITAVLGFWNMFAGPDRERAAAKAALEQVKVIPPPTEAPILTPEPTMPPAGYKILFGGEAPRPQIVKQWTGGGGGGGDEGGGGGGDGGGGGGGGGGAVTSTGSS